MAFSFHAVPQVQERSRCPPSPWTVWDIGHCCFWGAEGRALLCAEGWEWGLGTRSGHMETGIAPWRRGNSWLFTGMAPNSGLAPAMELQRLNFGGGEGAETLS